MSASTIVANCREALRAGTRLTAQQISQIIDFVESAAAADKTMVTDYTAQMAILAAFTGASSAATIVAAIATAKALLDPDAAALQQTSVAADTVADGKPLAGTY